MTFGNGSVQQGACAKGGMKVPLKTLQRHLAAKPNIVFCTVNESHTSKNCLRCAEVHRLHPCHHIVPGPLVEGSTKPLKHKVHGILACQGLLSPGEFGPRRAPYFIDRDVVGALNMTTLALTRLAGQPRPPRFTSPFWADKTRFTKHDLWPPSARLGRPPRPCAVKSQ